MMASGILSHFRRIVRDQAWGDPEWLTKLDEFDEPPLFTRTEELEPLRQLDPDTRGQIVMEIALSALDELAMAIATVAKPESVFACLTFLDWNLVDTGEQVVPTPCLFVSPKRHEELRAFALVPPRATESLKVQTWLRHIGREDIYVAEGTPPPFGDEPFRVYVGYRTGCRRFASVGDYVR
jgi:hypothetical protein